MDSNPADEVPSTSSYAVRPGYAGDRSPSLEPALLRTSRATIRFNELVAVAQKVRARAATHPMTVRVSKEHVEAGTFGNPRIQWSHDRADFELHQELRALTGEVVFHLRTSLEYLAYHLVWHDRGKPYRASKFPIVGSDREGRWAEIVQASLPGLNPENVGRIRNLQPFAGCEWIQRLSTIGNSDRHRSSVRVGVTLGAEFASSATPVAVDPDDSNWYIIQSSPTAEIQTEDGLPLEITMRDLCFDVASALASFEGQLPGPSNITVKRD